MKKINYTTGLGSLYLVISLIFFSCEKNLDYDFDQANVQPVLNATLNNNGVSFARLGYSAPVKGQIKNNRIIEGADIQLYDEESYLISFEEDGEGDYSLYYDYDIGKGYYIRVDTPYGWVESEMVYFYAAPQINDITLSDYILSDPPQPNDAILLNINLFIDELIPYYSFIVKGIIDGNPTDQLNNAWSIQSDETDGPCNPGNLFTNQCFINQNIEIPVRAPKYYGSFPIDPDDVYDGYIVEMLSLNESAYEASLYNFEYEFIDLIFSEPAPHYSNVKGGYGVIEAINISRKTVMMKNTN